MNTDTDETIYILGYWNNPYRPEKEYYWMRCEEDLKTAKQWGNRKQERGQPRQFTNWAKGKNSYFTNVDKFLAAANKVGLNPAL